MALTPNLTTITVEGEYVDVSGAPISGQVRFTPRATLKDSVADQVIINRAITVTLDSNGSFAVVLPASDDPSVIPTNFTYFVEELFSGGATYDITIPSGTVGGNLNLADVSPAIASGGSGSLYVTTAQYNDLNARLVVVENVRLLFDPLVAAVDAAEAAALQSQTTVQAAFAGIAEFRADVQQTINPLMLVGRAF
jgi:hypothetical protein